MFSLFKTAPANEDRLQMTSGSVLVCLDGNATVYPCLCLRVSACARTRVYVYLFACILLSFNSGSWQSQRERWHWNVSVPDLLGTKKGVHENACVCVCVGVCACRMEGCFSSRDVSTWKINHHLGLFCPKDRRRGGKLTNEHTCTSCIFHFTPRKQRVKLHIGSTSPHVPRPSVLSEHLTPCLDPAAIKARAICPSSPCNFFLAIFKSGVAAVASKGKDIIEWRMVERWGVFFRGKCRPHRGLSEALGHRYVNTQKQGWCARSLKANTDKRKEKQRFICLS